MGDYHSKRGRDAVLRSSYNICSEQYELMSEEQDGVCFICHGTGCTEYLAIDHCHTNGNVRGLLCQDCNRALGQFQDNVEYLQRAIDYLTREYDVPGSLSPKPPKKDHREKTGWKCVVTSPDGIFISHGHAAEYYSVHPTTIREWCKGVISPKSTFSEEKIFASQTELEIKYGNQVVKTESKYVK